MNELKIPKSYSLDPDVIKWVSDKAAVLTLEGLNSNDSKLVNEILRAAMDDDKHVQKIKSKIEPRIRQLAK